MKLCPKAEAVRAEYQREADIDRARIERYEREGDVSRAGASRSMLHSAKKTMAQKLNRHVSRCKECG